MQSSCQQITTKNIIQRIKNATIVSKHILCEALQNSDKVTLEDIEKILAHSNIHPMFSKHLFDYTTTAIVAGLTLNEAFLHLKETYDVLTPSLKQYAGFTPPVKCIEQKKMDSPPVPSSLLAFMSRTVPLKKALSKNQTPLCSSPIKTPTTRDRYNGGLENIDEISFFDINMPQVALVPKTGLQQGSVRIVSDTSFLIFMYQFVACRNLKLTSCNLFSYFIPRTR